MKPKLDLKPLGSFLFLAVCSNMSAAVFTTDSTWSASFRLQGTLNEQQDVLGVGGVSHTEVSLANGQIQVSSQVLAAGSGSTTSGTALGTFTNPITFQQTSIAATVSLDPFSFSYSSGPLALQPDGSGGLQFFLPTPTSLGMPSFTVTGMYEIVGTNETVSGPFSVTFNLVLPSSDAIKVNVSDFPNAVSLTNWAYAFSGAAFSNPIASVVVDGIGIQLAFSHNRNFLEPFAGAFGSPTEFQAVPEPSVSCALLLGVAVIALRRRKNRVFCL